MRRTLRLPALILLPLLLVAGLVIESRTDDAAVTTLRTAEMTATAAAAGTSSSTWYCAAGSATGVATGDGAGPAEQLVIVANASDAASNGTLTVYPEGAAPAAVPIQVAAHSQTEVRVSDVVKAPWAAALVETSGGEITVAHELAGPTGRSISNCASTPSADWYFPAGTTRVGTAMWIALFNPFPGEATVDLAFETENGARTSPSYQGIVVPGGSVVVKLVSETITLAEHASATVTTRSGRIIAEQVQSFEGREGGVKGLTATVGATTSAPIWGFPTGAPATVADAGESISMFNPGDSDTDVMVQVQLDDPGVNGTVEPFEVNIPAHRFAVVDVSADERVPKGVPHWVVVRSTDGADIVAERVLTGGGANGISYTMGLPVVATRWLATVAGGADISASQLSIANPSPTETVSVSLRHHDAGALSDVVEATDLTVAPGQRITTIDLRDLGFPVGSTVEVSSDIPVLVGQWLAFSNPQDISTPVGVPVAGTQSALLIVVGPSVGTNDQLPTDELPPTPPVADPDASTAPVEGDVSSTTTTTSSSSSSSSSSSTTAAAG